MTFLNPLLLFGLLAASIPIIIHLLNLRKLKTIEFSSLQFLNELQKTTMRRIKIKQWLLLALRTLMVIAIVMAFARPALRGSLAGLPFSGSARAKSTLVLLLDDSPSMSVRDQGGVLFVRAKEAASNILTVMNEGDDGYLIRLSNLRNSADAPPAHSPAELKKALEQLQPSQARASFRDALGVASRILAGSKNYNHEIYLITDAQATQFLRAANDTADLFGDHVKFFLSDVRSGATHDIENAGITSARITSRIIAQHKPIVVQATVQNAGPSALRSSIASLYLDNTRVVQQSLDIAAHNATTPSLQFSPARRGVQSGYIQIDDDAFDADNRRSFTLNVPNSIRVLAVGATANDTRLPVLALTLDRDSTTAGLFSVERTTEAQLASFDLSTFDLLLCAGVKDFSTNEAERIAQFLSAGGGMVIFPGKETDINNYNSVLFMRVGVPPSQPQKLFGTAASNSFLSFSKIDFDHPVFEGLFDQQTAARTPPNIESPKVYTAIQPRAGARGRPLVSLSDGTHFLTEYSHGAGKLLLVSVEAGMSWSDFPLKGIFVPLLYRAGLYLAESASGGQPRPFTVGEDITFSVRLRNRTAKDSYILRSPSGIDERVVPQFSPTTGTATFTSSHSFEAGTYDLRKLSGGKESELLFAVAVNVAKEETDLRHVSENELTNFAADVGLKPEQVQQLPATSSVNAMILESRFGVELWNYFLGLAIVLALSEMIVGRETRVKNAE